MYKRESFQLFQALMDRRDEDMLRWIFLYQAVPVEEPLEVEGRPAEAGEPAPARQAPAREPELPFAGARKATRNLSFNDPGATPSAFAARAERAEAHGGEGAAVQTIKREGPKVGRNDPCPCGSGKKYKKCHGQG